MDRYFYAASLGNPKGCLQRMKMKGGSGWFLYRMGLSRFAGGEPFSPPPTVLFQI